MAALAPAASAAGKKQIDLLFVQTAHRATLTIKHGVGTLKLHQVGPVTIFFSDRPDRVTGRMTNAEFVRDWTKGGKSSFKNDPPNAAIDAELDGEDVIVLLELRRPRLRGHTLTYRVKLLHEPSVGLDHYAGRLEPRLRDAGPVHQAAAAR